ncbi:Coiled-coil domain-containing protein [Ooceraea biroi]|uniref:Coiled-coil domain-containing protein n=1 Tax=Ooceraea biroi TaxID=2015173 RepID=A0A026WEW1_OOCBI|nr:Coiled-coil domain-containing protein [Ooceraea biroi]
MANKQYGLILPKKQQQTTTSKLGNVFGDDDTSDEDDGTDWVKKAFKAEGEKNKIKKQTKLDIQKALNEDPTIYQYDEVYDDMECTKSKSEINKQKEKKPRYIQNLLKTAERRKKEQEHRIERMVLKEREAEGDMYADKESFVTATYRTKLEEFKKMEEEDARMSRLEAIADVTKQENLLGFYRHLYEQTVEYKGETNNDESNDTTEKDVKQDKTQNLASNINEENQKDATVKEAPAEILKATVKPKKSRQYRKRAIETYESDSETETSKEELKKDETVTSPENKNTDKSEVQESEKKEQELDKNDANIIENTTDTNDKDINTKDAKIPLSTKEIAPGSEETENKKKPVETKDRRSILEKRTIGPVLEAALQRYYARKAKRTAAT